MAVSTLSSTPETFKNGVWLEHWDPNSGVAVKLGFSSSMFSLWSCAIFLAKTSDTGHARHPNTRKYRRHALRAGPLDLPIVFGLPGGWEKSRALIGSVAVSDSQEGDKLNNRRGDLRLDQDIGQGLVDKATLGPRPSSVAKRPHQSA